MPQHPYIHPFMTTEC